MITAANNLEFEKAALLRDQIRELKRAVDGAAEAKTGSTPSSKPVNYRKSKSPRGSTRNKVPF
jgi:hypothetical protein